MWIAVSPNEVLDAVADAIGVDSADQLTVTARDNVVTLTGTVRSTGDRDAAIARSCKTRDDHQVGAGGTDGLGRRRHRRQLRTIAPLDVVGAVRPILPGALGVAPGIGLVLKMIGAIVTHVRYGETGRLAVPIVLLGLALFIAAERFGAHSL